MAPGMGDRVTTMHRWTRRCALAVLAMLLAGAGGCAITGKCGLHECPEEAAIRAEVESLLDQHPELRPPNMVHVQVRDNMVTLSGQVNSDYERRLAESVALEAKGVQKVVNLIGLTYTQR